MEYWSPGVLKDVPGYWSRALLRKIERARSLPLVKLMIIFPSFFSSKSQLSSIEKQLSSFFCINNNRYQLIDWCLIIDNQSIGDIDVTFYLYCQSIVDRYRLSFFNPHFLRLVFGQSIIWSSFHKNDWESSITQSINRLSLIRRKAIGSRLSYNIHGSNEDELLDILTNRKKRMFGYFKTNFSCCLNQKFDKVHVVQNIRTV